MVCYLSMLRGMWQAEYPLSPYDNRVSKRFHYGMAMYDRFIHFGMWD